MQNSPIHPTAIIDSAAHLEPGVRVGAYSIITGPVRIGTGTTIGAHAHLEGRTTIGTDCRIGPGAFVGMPPQHAKADPNIGELIIGDGVTIRETATINRSSVGGADHATRIGDRCFIMTGAHVAHDCVLESDVTLANSVLLGGHCVIGKKAFLGGACGVHQFVRIGRLAIVAGNESISQDVPPFAAVRYGGLKGYNAIGCRRDGWDQATLVAMRAAFRCLHSNRLVSDAVAAIRANVPDLPLVRELLMFIAASKRGIAPSILPRAMPRALIALAPTV